MASYEQDFAESLQHYETSAETAEWCRCSHQTCLLCFKLSIRQQEMKVNLDAHAELACLFAQLGYIISRCSHQIRILLNSIKLYLGPSYIGQPLTQQWSHVPIVPILWHTFDITCGADVTTRFQAFQFILMHYALRFTALSNYVLLSASYVHTHQGFIWGETLVLFPLVRVPPLLSLQNFIKTLVGALMCACALCTPLHFPCSPSRKQNAGCNSRVCVS